MGTCWLFCLAASALSSGRAAEEVEEERKRKIGRRRRRRNGVALGMNIEQIWKEKKVREGAERARRGEKLGARGRRNASLRMMNWLSSC